jgi:hypothetical protein
VIPSGELIPSEWRRDAAKTGPSWGWYEHRASVFAIAVCPECGDEVPLAAETDQWVLRAPGIWQHDGYGPAVGFHCGYLIADWYEGTFVYEAPAAGDAA